MLMLKITNYLNGIVRVRVSGWMPEKFINLCMAHSIILWGITKHNDNIIAFLRLSDFFRIRPLARASQTHIEVIGYHGLPFTIKRIKKRKMLVAGGIIFFILLQTLTSYIWFVDVTGQVNLAPDQIRQVARQYGLRPGVKKDSLNIKAIENAIMLNSPEVSWVGINLTGTRAVIEVAEKTLLKPEDKSPANVIAAKDGIITEIIAISGTAVVKKGDTVKKGDILIKGLVETPLPPDGQASLAPPPVQAHLVRARGITKARVWYEGYGEAGTVEMFSERTGRKSREIVLRINGNQFTFKQPGARFASFETEVVHKKLPQWRNSELAVESTINTLHELVIHTREITLEEARNLAASHAMQAAWNKVPENVQVLSRNVEMLKTAESGIIRVKAVVETIEDIGQAVNITQ